jgi:excisionase family DNA binding protein
VYNEIMSDTNGKRRDSQSQGLEKKSIQGLEWLTVRQAAKELKLEESYVRRLLIQGKLRGVKWGRDWMVQGLDYKRKRKPKRRVE